jgi:hypothetical protein
MLARAGSYDTSARPGSSCTLTDCTPGVPFSTRVTLPTHPWQLMPCTFNVTVSIARLSGR